ncbi:hypothetical protein B5X24_HaOG208663 [Helicoverpa armigera]|uniref:Uncharacterized protein n=1 Tax=Helicoverpa armigera TaxID=29058 RepID=A0A2W1BFS9_HELAM|nr:hypothetical protein B5X24_HaOG208663 [Helicoverpa armigera]
MDDSLGCVTVAMRARTYDPSATLLCHNTSLHVEVLGCYVGFPIPTRLESEKGYRLTFYPYHTSTVGTGVIPAGDYYN